MTQHRQIHVWIKDSDYRFVRELSVATEESISSVVRRLIKFERQRLRSLREDGMALGSAPAMVMEPPGDPAGFGLAD